MIDWYWLILNTGYCDITLLMTLSLALPALIIMVLVAWITT